MCVDDGHITTSPKKSLREYVANARQRLPSTAGKHGVVNIITVLLLLTLPLVEASAALRIYRDSSRGLELQSHINGPGLP